MKRNTGLRLDDATIARVNTYLERLRREPGRGEASQADAIRALIDHGLVAVDVREKRGTKPMKARR
jgi:hypothetical protein